MADFVSKGSISLLDYGAGNVRSLRNAILSLGYEVLDIRSSNDIKTAKVIIFPGVGSFGQAMKSLASMGYVDALKEYIREERPFFGICIGMQCLFEGSEESISDIGLGIIPGRVKKFDTSLGLRVPHIGWNGISSARKSPYLRNITAIDKVYFVHSFCAHPTSDNLKWILSVTDYGPQRYISAVQRGHLLATQFHPEKSGAVGLRILNNFLDAHCRNISVPLEINPRLEEQESPHAPAYVPLGGIQDLSQLPKTSLAKRVIACLDVRTNDDGDLVVTKGDQYDVREAAQGGDSSSQGRGQVRNLGLPKALCQRYFEDGADEVVFLNITSFKKGVLEDTPMLQLLEQSSEKVFVPLCVGGGIRQYEEPGGKLWSAVEVAAAYFRAGADKVSIGSDAVEAVEEYIANGRVRKGTSSIEQISYHYGAQAVVVSVDPKRVYVSDPSAAPLHATVVELEGPYKRGPDGQRYCWWQVTVKGGRETRDMDAVALAKGVEALGAGEIMLNCIDMDGQCDGYDLALLAAVQSAVSLPVIASSGAGKVEHFSEVFQVTDVHAALAAGIFHREEVRIRDVKNHLNELGIVCRL